MPAIASIRGRSLSGASSEIISSSTHIEHGLKPSSIPITNVKSGRPTCSSETVKPSALIANFSASAAGASHDSAPSSASQAPVSGAALPLTAAPSSARRIMRSLPAAFE